MDVSRKESMSPDGFLRLHIQQDGDVIVAIRSGENDGGLDPLLPFASVEFCTPFGGGGGSKYTHAALRNLALAMAKDNADPHQQGRAGEFEGKEILKNLIDQTPFELLSGEMQVDNEVAWGWYCNIKVEMTDIGVKEESADKAARNFMSRVFGVRQIWEPERDDEEVEESDES